MMDGNGSNAGRTQMNGQGMALGNAGATDNRLSLNPNEFLDGEVADWKDNQVYRLDGVIVRQVSPGEMEVLSIAKGVESNEDGNPSESTEGPEATDEGQNTDETGEAKDYPNPAVRKLMYGERS